MELYRKNFRPSEVLDKPYGLVSVGAVAGDDPVEARRQSASAAMMRMFQRKTYSLLPPEEVEAYHYELLHSGEAMSGHSPADDNQPKPADSRSRQPA